MSYYEDRIKALEARIEEMAMLNRMKAVPVEAKLMDRIGELNKEVAALKAEVDNLRKSAEINPPQSPHDDDTCPHLVVLGRLEAENARLKAEVERLTKAGDGLYKSMLEIGCNEMADNFQYDAWWGSMKDWNAAKEGKQSK